MNIQKKKKKLNTKDVENLMRNFCSKSESASEKKFPFYFFHASFKIKLIPVTDAFNKITLSTLFNYYSIFFSNWCFHV